MSIERVPWDVFMRERFDFEQGHHCTLIGATGSGKTVLANALLPRRQFVAALATKPVDRSMDYLIRRERYKKIREWPPPPLAGRTTQRVVLWPDISRPELLARQQAVFADALRQIYTSGGWTVFADELWYLTHMLKLKGLLELIWTQGRSIGVTVIGGTQRPAHIPLLAYDQCTHLFAWRDNDETNLKRLGGLGGNDASVMRKTIANLPRHDAFYLNTRTGDMCITRAPKGGDAHARPREPGRVRHHGRLRDHLRLLLAHGRGEAQ